MILGPRVAIIGNSGSGKSTLAKSLGSRLGLDAIDLDTIHWLDKVGSKRDENEARTMVTAIARTPGWIIEGVYGWLIEPALPFATSLIWLDLPWPVCQEGLAFRGPWKSATADEHLAFLNWAEAYRDRQTSTSLAGHLALFENFAGQKLRFETRSAVDDLVADIS